MWAASTVKSPMPPGSNMTKKTKRQLDTLAAEMATYFIHLTKTKKR